MSAPFQVVLNEKWVDQSPGGGIYRHVRPGSDLSLMEMTTFARIF